jgi:hypothetical protein
MVIWTTWFILFSVDTHIDTYPPLHSGTGPYGVVLACFLLAAAVEKRVDFMYSGGLQDTPSPNIPPCHLTKQQKQEGQSKP